MFDDHSPQSDQSADNRTHFAAGVARMGSGPTLSCPSHRVHRRLPAWPSIGHWGPLCRKSDGRRIAPDCYRHKQDWRIGDRRAPICQTCASGRLHPALRINRNTRNQSEPISQPPLRAPPRFHTRCAVERQSDVFDHRNGNGRQFAQGVFGIRKGQTRGDPLRLQR